MNLATVGLSKRCGIVKKRRVEPTKIVLLANSSGVSKGSTAAGTAPLFALLSCVKSPFRRRCPGSTFLLANCTVSMFQRRSYAPRKKVFLLPKTGPLIDPPVSLRLKDGFG